MSYSFSVRGATKAEARDKVVTELDKVVAAQPIHKVDEHHALAAVEAFLEIIPGNVDGKDFAVSVSGSVGWSGTLGHDAVVTSASVNVSTSLVPSVAAHG